MLTYAGGAERHRSLFPASLCPPAGTQFTRFTGTKVGVLTHRPLLQRRTFAGFKAQEVATILWSFATVAGEAPAVFEMADRCLRPRRMRMLTVADVCVC
jgi:hypothetical protein